MSEIVFAWPISSWFGWGIRGLGYTLNWPGTALSAMLHESPDLGPDDPRRKLLGDRLRQSTGFIKFTLEPGTNPRVEINAPVFVALGNDLKRQPVACGKGLRGRPTIACPVFDDVAEVEANVGLLKDYDKVVVASRWNQDVLDSLGVSSTLCHEGIDPVLFNPQAKKPRNDGRFRVFSGGKVEHRKGQDIVIAAFKAFAQTHPDAVLVAAWSSPFQSGASHFDIPGSHIGKPNFGAWLQREGLKPHQYEIVTPRPNWMMPEVYGSCDVAVFPNRCEGGTNFVAMECMACGVPTIIRGAYGQADLPYADPPTWYGGSDVWYFTAMLEATYKTTDFVPKPLSDYWTWERHCKEMAGIASD